MSLNPTEPTAVVSGRALRVVVVGAALVALLLAVAMVVRSNSSPDRNRVETAAGEDRAAPTKAPSRRPERPTTRTTPTVADPVHADRTVPGRPIRPTSTTAPPALGPTPLGPESGAVTGTRRPRLQPSNPSNAPQMPTSSSTTSSPTTVVLTPQETLTPRSPAVKPKGPTREQQACNNLGLVAVGDPAPRDAAAEAAWTRFRSAKPQILDTDDLVCGKPVAGYLDDLLIQWLQVAGEPHGILLGGTDPAHPVLWLSEVEWTSYRWQDPKGTNHNFTGMPTGRETIGGHDMVRTTRGAVIMVRSDSWGYTVVGGAWDVWMASGGPAGPMGLPEAKAIKSEDGGAHQDFTNGVLELPGVTSELEAEVMPASRYVWVPLTADDLAEPPPAPHSIVDVTGVSYYVDRNGIRHWLETTSDWSCATHNLGAKTVETVKTPGWQAARAPLGPVFTCPPKPPA